MWVGVSPTATVRPAGPGSSSGDGPVSTRAPFPNSNAGRSATADGTDPVCQFWISHTAPDWSVNDATFAGPGAWSP